MARVLVVYFSKEGQTEHISHRMCRRLEDRGHVVRLINLRTDDSEAGADDYDATIMAGSIHRGNFAPELAGFLMRHGPAVRSHVSAFVTVSLSAASHDATEISALNEIANRFLFEAGWHPDFTEHVAGAVHDDQLSVFEKLVVHHAVEQHGAQLEASGHTEFTDWTKLNRFVDTFAGRL